MSRKPGRPKAGREPLDRERILTTALELIDAHGVEALSMRRLADALEVDPMALYHHLPNKRALFAGVTEMVFAELRIPVDEAAPWQARVRVFAHTYRSVIRAHPHLTYHLITDVEAGADASLDASEALYAALAAAGLSPQDTVRVADLIVDYINGFTLAERARPLGQPEDRRELVAQLAQQPSNAHPTLKAVFDSLTEGELGVDFEFGVNVILAGVEMLQKGPAYQP